MSIPIRMPDRGRTVDEVKVVAWLVGDTLSFDLAPFEIRTFQLQLHLGDH